jgi:hypothetical protein
MEERRKLLLWQVGEYRTLIREANGQAGQALQPDLIPGLDGKPYTKMTAAQTIEAILKAKGSGMRVVDIAAAASKGGYGGEGADPSKVVPNFSSTLSRLMKTDTSPFVRGNERGMIYLREWSNLNGQETNIQAT